MDRQVHPTRSSPTISPRKATIARFRPARTQRFPSFSGIAAVQSEINTQVAHSSDKARQARDLADSGRIERDLGERFVGVGRVHLVGRLVAGERPAGADRVAERAVEGAGVLGGVGHDLDVGVARAVEPGADRAHAPVHHVAGRDDVAAGLGLHDRLADQRLDRLVVQDLAVLHQPVVPERVERVEGHIADHADVGHLPLDLAHRPADQVVRVPGLLARRRLLVALDVREHRDRRDAEFLGMGRPLDQPVVEGAQVECLLLLLQVLPVVVVPSGPLSLVFRPGFDPIVLFDRRGNNPSHKCQVLRRVLGSHLTVVLLEGYVQDPMEPVLDLPVPAGRFQDLLGVGLKAGD